MRTIYKVEDEYGGRTYTEDTEAAESYSQLGFRVSATTGER
jgi:hypothetical protein